MRWLDVLYAKACRWAGGFKALRRAKFGSDELRENLELVGLEVQPDEVVALSLLALLASALLAAAVIAACLTFDRPIIILAALPLPPLAFVSVGWYPSWRAERERVRGLGEVPILISYMSMSMKISPNLERSASFAAECIDGPLGRSLREALMHVYLRAAADVSEALERFGRRWGRWCGGLKRSLYLIGGSAAERSETNRFHLLDKAVEVSFEGVREQMQDFASGLQLSTSVVYSIGVLLPLALLAVLPVLATVDVRIDVWEVAAIYCVLLPAAVYALSRRVLSRRPVAFPVPSAPAAARGARAGLLASALGAMPVLAGFLLGTGDARALSCLWGISIGVAAYLHLSCAEAYEWRARVERMEEEFCDSLVQLGNRIAEGKPAEEAFESVASLMRGAEISRLFSRVSANIKFGGMGLRKALFDEEHGALHEVRSRTIEATMRLLVEVIERSNRAAGEAVLRMADHLKAMRRLELEVRHSLGEVAASMRSVALFFAPLIASVTARLQLALSSKASSIPFLSSGQSLSPPSFLLVLGVYVLLLTMILLSCAVEISVVEVSLKKRVIIARALPIAMAVFTVGALVSGQFVAALVG
ncbi:MAG: hypothetical protein QXP65_01875 [Candidatus Hadarchaeales archaeon]